MFKLQQLSLKQNSYEAFKLHDPYPLISESMNKKMAESCSALIASWFPPDLMKHELCFPFSPFPLFSASLREVSQGATD